MTAWIFSYHKSLHSRKKNQGLDVVVSQTPVIPEFGTTENNCRIQNARLKFYTPAQSMSDSQGERSRKSPCMSEVERLATGWEVRAQQFTAWIKRSIITKLCFKREEIGAIKQSTRYFFGSQVQSQHCRSAVEQGVGVTSLYSFNFPQL